MPWCPRAAPSATRPRWKWPRGIRLMVARRTNVCEVPPCGNRQPGRSSPDAPRCGGTPECRELRLLPRQKIPPHLDHHSLDPLQQRCRRRQPRPDLSQGQTQGRNLTTVAKTPPPPTAGRPVQKTGANSDGVPKLKTLEQIFKEKGGYEIVGETLGSAMVGWKCLAPSSQAARPAKQARLPSRSRQRRHRSGMGHRRIGRRGPSRSRLERSRRERRDRHRPHRPRRMQAKDFRLYRGPRICRLSPTLDEFGDFIDGFRPARPENQPSTSATTPDFILANLQEKQALFAMER